MSASGRGWGSEAAVEVKEMEPAGTATSPVTCFFLLFYYCFVIMNENVYVKANTVQCSKHK